MTREQVEEMVTLLSKEFAIKRPAVRWCTRTRRGWAYTRQWRIVIGPRCCRGVEHATIHEFAHILAAKRYGPKVNHDERFMYCLWHVATAWYGNPASYGWASEYKRVAAFGKRRLGQSE